MKTSDKKLKKFAKSQSLKTELEKLWKVKIVVIPVVVANPLAYFFVEPQVSKLHHPWLIETDIFSTTTAAATTTAIATTDITVIITSTTTINNATTTNH